VLRQGSETVLVVEDEAAVRMLVRGVLESNGYRVLEARHGAEALLICDEHKDPIHLLMTDVIMPEMSGTQLAERVSAQRPEMKTLYMSGYTDKAIVHHGVLESGTDFLQKPFTPDTVVRKVRAVLDGNPRVGSALSREV
jgi:DNA-binding NtrC family response regulator